MSTTRTTLERGLRPDQRGLNDLIDQLIKYPPHLYPGHCQHTWLQIVRRLQHDQAQTIAKCEKRETELLQESRQSYDLLLSYMLKTNDENRALSTRIAELGLEHSKLRNEAVKAKAQKAQAHRLHDAIVKDNEAWVHYVVGQVHGVNGWYTSGITSDTQYANSNHQQLVPNTYRASNFEEETCEELPRKKRLRSRARTSRPKSVVMCTQCYANGLECDHDDTCAACVESGKQCKRKQCRTYSLGPRQCQDAHCTDAHPEDGYANTSRMTGLKRKEGLPPVPQVSRW
jgi:hypothetical protein